MLTAGKDLPSLSKADIDSEIRALLFSANGEYLVSGDGEWVRVWRIENGKQMARMEAELVNCLAVSKDGLWISAGTERGWVFVWNAKTYKLVFSHQEDSDINGVDFSPLDSSRLVIASRNCTANVWDTTICQQVVGPLHHEGSVRAAKYSPQGGRIATATYKSVRVYDSNDGRLLVDVPVQVTPWYHTALLWSSQQLFVVSKNQIKQLEASTGSIVSEWLVSDANCWSCISLQQHSEFITYSAYRSITFWDTSTHARLGQRYTLNHALSRRPVSCNWWKTRENNSQKTVRHHREYWVPLDKESSEQISCFDHFPHRIPPPCLVHTLHFRAWVFRSTKLRLICGRAINSQMRKRY